MALRDTITKWYASMCLLDDGMFDQAISKLLEIQNPSAKIIYDIGCLNMLQGRIMDAVRYFNTSIEQDGYLAVAFYQRGTCHFELQRFHDAKSDFLRAKFLVQDNGIDYKKLGADVLLTPDVLNHCVSMTEESSKTKKNIKLETLSVKDCIFRPQKALVENLTKQDFLGSAQVISSTNEKDIVTALKKQGAPHSAARVRATASSSTPSSPSSSRSDKAKKMFIPPPPTRPPPRLPADFTADHKLHHRSRSLEDVTAYDHMCGGLESVETINSNTLTAGISKPLPVHVAYKTANGSKQPSSLVSSTPLQHAVSETFPKTVTPQQTKSNHKVSSFSSHSRNNEAPVYSLAKNIPGKTENHGVKLSLRSDVSHIKPSPSITEDKNLSISQNPVLSHTSQMKLHFEKKDDLKPVGGSRGDAEQLKNLLSFGQTRGVKTHHSLQPALVSGSCNQISPKPSNIQTSPKPSSIQTSPKPSNIQTSPKPLSIQISPKPSNIQISPKPSNIQISPKPSRPPPPKFSK